jgi:hypothetical protein
MVELGHFKGGHDEVECPSLQYLDIEVQIHEPRYDDNVDRKPAPSRHGENVCPDPIQELRFGKHQVRWTVTP